MGTGWKTVVRDAALVALASSAVALGANALRSDSLELVASRPHVVLVPCPTDVLGPAEPIAAADPRLRAPGTLLVDAREADAFATWHADGAVRLTYDLLEESPQFKDEIASLLAEHGRATLVAVYGDDEAGFTTASGAPGDEAGTGFRLAGALSAQGMRQVHYVLGGAAALRAALAAPAGTP